MCLGAFLITGTIVNHNCCCTLYSHCRECKIVADALAHSFTEIKNVDEENFTGAKMRFLFFRD